MCADVGQDILEPPAMSDLVHTGLAHASADGHQCAARVLCGTYFSVPVRAVTSDERQMSQGLDVVDQRRQPIDTPLERPAQCWLAPAAIDEVDQGVLLT